MDSDEMRVHAARWRAQGELAQRLAAVVARQAGVRWRAPSATRYRAQVEESAEGLTRVARTCEEVAETYERAAAAMMRQG